MPDSARQIQHNHNMEQMLRLVKRLNRFSVTLSGTLDLDKLLSQAAEQAAELLDAQRCDLGVFVSGEVNFSQIYSYSQDSSPHKFSSLDELHPTEAQNIRSTLHSGVPQLIEVCEMFGVTRCNAASALFVPLRGSQSNLGVLALLNCPANGAFTESDLELAESLGRQLAAAIQTAFLFQQARQQTERMSMLMRIGMAVSSKRELKNVLQELYQQCRQIASVDAFYVGLYETEHGKINFPLFLDKDQALNIEPHDIKINPGLTGYIVQSGKPLHIPDTNDPGLVLPVPLIRTSPDHARTFLGVPLIWRDEVIGVMSVQSYTPNAYSPEIIRLVETIATQTATAIANAQLFDQVQQLAHYDSLTGLFSRGHFFALAEQELRFAIRYAQPISVIMIDLDFFKEVNDQHGHTLGDDVMHQISEQMRGALRTVDIIGRYGGDEFIVLLPATKAEEAVVIAERLRQRLDDFTCQTPKGPIHLTMSLGVADVNWMMGDGLEEAIQNADQALYAAKAGGRNQACQWREAV